MLAGLALKIFRRSPGMTDDLKKLRRFQQHVSSRDTPYFKGTSSYCEGVGDGLGDGLGAGVAVHLEFGRT